MFLDGIFIIAGLAALIVGAEALVRGASGIASLAKVSPSVIALTVVAAGTSMPELMVSVQAALSGSAGMAIGNAVGSNFLNLGLVLGATALITSLGIGRNTFRFEWPVMMFSTLVFYLLARDGTIDRLEGACMAAGLAAFLAYAVALDKRNVTESRQEKPPVTASFGRTGGRAVILNLLALSLGIGLLALGANSLVRGSVGLARDFGVSDTVIGLTVVAVGTSAPELVTSIVAALRGQGSMAVGNIIGSSVFNLLGILGITALVSPLSVPAEILSRDAPWLLGISAALFPMMWSGRLLNRLEGAALLGTFGVYMFVLISGA